MELPPYNKMEKSEAIDAIKQHCNIPIYSNENIDSDELNEN